MFGGLGAACDRDGRDTRQGAGAGTAAAGPGAAPAGSVFSVANAIGTCDDLSVCATECDGGSADRCRRLGVNYEFGKGVDKDGARATALYERACAMSNADACVAAGRMYEYHHGVVKDDAKAAAFYGRACDSSDPTGCANLAIMLENGRGVAVDLERAGKLYDQACAKGAGLACERAKLLRTAAEAGKPSP